MFALYILGGVILALPFVFGMVGNLIASLDGGDTIPPKAYKKMYTHGFVTAWNYFNFLGKLLFTVPFLYAIVTFQMGAFPLTAMVYMPEVVGPTWRFLFVKRKR